MKWCLGWLCGKMYNNHPCKSGRTVKNAVKQAKKCIKCERKYRPVCEKRVAKYKGHEKSEGKKSSWFSSKSKSDDDDKPHWIKSFEVTKDQFLISGPKNR